MSEWIEPIPRGMEHYATTDETCADVRRWTGEAVWTLADLLALGLPPYFWVELPGVPRGPLDLLRAPGIWGRIQCPGGILEQREGHVFVREWSDGWKTYSAHGLNGRPIRVGSLRFPRAAADDFFELAGAPVMLVPLVEAGDALAIGARRYRDCLEANLPVPSNPYRPMPRGIGKLAKAEGVSRPAYVESVRRYLQAMASKVTHESERRKEGAREESND